MAAALEADVRGLVKRLLQGLESEEGCSRALQEVGPALLAILQQDEEEEEEEVSLGSSSHPEREPLQGHGAVVVEAVMAAVQQLWRDSEEPLVDGLHHGLALLGELLKWDSFRQQVLRKQDHAVLLADMGLTVGHASSPLTLIKDVLELFSVLAVDGAWREALGAAGCLVACCEAALRHGLDEPVQARALKLLHLMCFDEENVRRVLESGKLVVVYKALVTHEGSFRVARHGCGCLYFLALDLLKGQKDDSYGVTLPHLIDAVATSLHRHSSKGGFDLIAPALGFLRTFAMDPARLLEIATCCDLRLLVDLLGASSCLGEGESIHDCLEIISRVLQDDNACTIALMASDGDGASDVDEAVAYLRQILLTLQAGGVLGGSDTKTQEVLALLDGLGVSTPSMPCTIGVAAPIDLDTPPPPPSPPPRSRVSSDVMDIVTVIEEELEETRRGLEALDEADHSLLKHHPRGSRERSVIMSVNEHEQDIGVDGVSQLEREGAEEAWRHDKYDGDMRARWHVNRRRGPPRAAASPSDHPKEASPSPTVSLVRVAERLATDHLDRESRTSSSSCSSSSHDGMYSPSRCRLFENPQLVSHEVATSLQECFTRLVAHSTFRCGWRYAYSPEGYYLDDRISVEELQRFVARCGIYKLDEKEVGRDAGAHIPRYCHLMQCVYKQAHRGVNFEVFCEFMMMVARDRFFDEEPLVALALLAKALTEYLYGPIFGDGGTAEVEGQSGARQAGEGHEQQLREQRAAAARRKKRKEGGNDVILASFCRTDEELEGLKLVIKKAKAKLQAIFTYYSSEVPSSSSSAGGGARDGVERRGPPPRRMRLQQLLDFCRTFCVCPGLVPHQLCVDVFVLMSSDLCQDPHMPCSYLYVPPAEDPTYQLPGDVDDQQGLSLSQYMDWVAMVALESEWFKRKKGDAATRLSRFLDWLDTSLSSDRVYHHQAGLQHMEDGMLWVTAATARRRRQRQEQEQRQQSTTFSGSSAATITCFLGGSGSHLVCESHVV